MSADAGTVRRRAEARIPTDLGEFRLLCYANDRDDKEHLAFVRGEVNGQREVLVRIHSECFTGDVLGSRRCDCGEQLQLALELIGEAGAGVVVYLRQEGRGLGLLGKLRAYNLQDLGYDTVDANLILGHQADERDYVMAALILQDLGVASIRLLTNNPHKIENLRELGVEVAARLPLQAPVRPENAAYLRTKAERLRHQLCLEKEPPPRKLPILAEVNYLLAGAGEHRRCTGRPFVTVSYAQSLDGSIAARLGHPLSLSGGPALVLTHALRAAHEAILVGIGTVLADDPRLNVRLVAGRHPQPVVVDSRLRFPLYANLLKNNGRRPWIATGEQADAGRQAALEEGGARILRLPGPNGWVDLTALLQRLGEMGINSLMVEGGGQIITSFIAARLIDQMVITIAPLLVGGVRVALDLAQSYPAPFPRLRNLNCQRVGDDLVLRGDPDWQG
jgi:3,4-dihydroxy 2-butanone 4-phosphate synthase/GTP cyclohydrolase II